MKYNIILIVLVKTARRVIIGVRFSIFCGVKYIIN